MEQSKNLKIRKVSAYILPFISFIALSLLIEYVGFTIFDTNDLTYKYILGCIMSSICSIVFILVGFYIEPENKKKTIKVLSIIICVIFLLAIYGKLDSPFYYTNYILGIISAIITYFVLLRKLNNK